MSGSHPPDARLLELAADRATIGLEPHETLELETLLRGAGPTALELVEQVECAATSVHLAFLPRDQGPPPGLAERLRSSAQGVMAEQPAPLTRARGRAWIGWLAAAAAVLFAVLIPRLLPQDSPPSANERMAALSSSAQDLMRIDWTPGPDELGETVSGDLIWSPERQEGYMRLANLPPNDARELQYQLWIFDTEREEPPVDGGVFDVSQDGEVVIPIVAKLEVFEPHLFAITAERPGGVVVSKRERILALADASAH